MLGKDVYNARMVSLPSAPRYRRANGLLILGLVVAVGMLSGAVPFQAKAPGIKAGIVADLKVNEERMSEVQTPEQRLAAWLDFGVPQIHNRLRMLAFSPSMPFLVTHAVETSGGLHELWGIDFRDPDSVRVEAEGMVIRVHVPEPVNLGLGRLEGDNAERVPVYPAGGGPESPRERVLELTEWFLGGMAKAVARDIQGASLEILVGE